MGTISEPFMYQFYVDVNVLQADQVAQAAKFLENYLKEKAPKVDGVTKCEVEVDVDEDSGIVITFEGTCEWDYDAGYEVSSDDPGQSAYASAPFDENDLIELINNGMVESGVKFNDEPFNSMWGNIEFVDCSVPDEEEVLSGMLDSKSYVNVQSVISDLLNGNSVRESIEKFIK